MISISIIIHFLSLCCNKQLYSKKKNTQITKSQQKLKQMGKHTRCLAFLTAVIIMWWNSISNSTILLQPTLDGKSDVTSSNNTINTTTTSSENYLSRDAPKNCHRRCTHYKSKIFYDEPTDGGLDDRIRLINAMTNLASFLCAELYILVSKIPF